MSSTADGESVDSLEIRNFANSSTRNSVTGRRHRNDSNWPRGKLWLTVSVATCLGLLLTYQGVRLGYFRGVTEVDDGVYYGEGVMLMHGLVPYHSYLDVQPPGMALLMAPFGLLGRVASNRVGFECARVFVAALGVANVVLLGRLLRRRHWVSVLAGLAVLGFYLDSLTAVHTVLLEPFLVFGTLLGFLVIFDDTETATLSTSGWLVAGAILGVTTSV
jgi:hypothetical protein